MNRLGQQLYRLAGRPLVLGFSLSLAVLAAVLVVYRPTLHPLGMEPRDLQIAAASTVLQIGRPSQLPNNSIAYGQSVNAGLLAANVMISPAVTNAVARRLGIDPRAIATAPPTTDNVPAALIQPGSSGGPEDIFALPGHYRLEIQEDPTAPMLFVYTQAPSGADAIRLANSASSGLIAYLKTIQTRNGVPIDRQLSVKQLGTAEGGVAHTGGLAQIVLLVFCGTLGCALLLFSKLSRALERPRPRRTNATLGSGDRLSTQL
jgi:hypothetical protein